MVLMNSSYKLQSLVTFFTTNNTCNNYTETYTVFLQINFTLLQRKCKLEGGYVLEINSKDENDLVKDMFKGKQILKIKEI